MTTIQHSKVYDPAAEDGDLEQQVRLHLNVTDMPEEPTFMTLNVGPFSVSHYGKYMKIFCDEPYWDDEDTNNCAFKFNNHFATVEFEPVVPVLILETPPPGTSKNAIPFYSDFYVKVSEVAAMLRYVNRQPQTERDTHWEVVPDIDSAIRKEHRWEIRDAHNICIRCSNYGSQVPTGKRRAPMCNKHRAEWNVYHANARENMHT